MLKLFSRRDLMEVETAQRMHPWSHRDSSRLRHPNGASIFHS
jgi:hypothetical protein